MGATARLHMLVCAQVAILRRMSRGVEGTQNGRTVFFGADKASARAFIKDGSSRLKAHDSQHGVLLGRCQYVVGELHDTQDSTIPPCSFVTQCGSGET